MQKQNESADNLMSSPCSNTLTHCSLYTIRVFWIIALQKMISVNLNFNTNTIHKLRDVMPPPGVTFRRIIVLLIAILTSACSNLTEEADNSFTIGGQTFRLVNSIVLQNNDEQLTVTGEGSFNFKNESPFGANYDVKIVTQPTNPNQRCTIQSGKGVVGNTDVINIAVVCTTLTYEIGGNISGLPSGLGEPIKLRLNGKDLLETFTNGVFVFEQTINSPIEYPDHTEYTVEILIPPKDPDLTCSILNAEGKVNGSDIDNIIINCEDLTPPTVTNTVPKNTALAVSRTVAPEIFFSEAMDPDSISQLDIFPIGANITYNESKRSIRISPDTLLAPNTSYIITLTGEDSNSPSTYITDNAGLGLISTFSAEFTTADGAWSHPKLPESPTLPTLIEQTTKNARSPHLAVDSTGNMMAVWQQFDGVRSNIYANYYEVGLGWGTAALIETDNTDAFNPQVIFDGPGSAMAIWQQSDGAYSSIFANRFIASNGWNTTPSLVENVNLGDAHTPQLAVDSNNNIIAVWSQNDGNSYKIYSSRYSAGSWQAAPDVLSNNTTYNARKPKLAIAGNNNIFVTWQQTSETYSNIYSARYTGTWQTAELIENNTAGHAYNPEITVDDLNNVYVVWEQTDGLQFSIWGNRLSGASWSGAFLLETSDSGDAFNPQLASDTSGNIFITWQQYDGSNYRIWNTRLTVASDFSATPVGTPQVISTESNYDALNPQIVLDSNDKAIAVWSQHNGEVYQLTTSRHVTGPSLTWGEPEIISFASDGDAIEPSLATDSNGHSFLLWSEFDSIEYNIYFNQYSIP